MSLRASALNILLTMPRYIRTFLPGATYFFTVALADRTSYLLVREIQRLRTAYADAKRQYPFETLAICILPDHLHAIWRLPPEDGGVPRRWAHIKRVFSAGVQPPRTLSRSQESRHERGIWQRRYWEHQIRDEDDFARHVAYIHFNPVKHGHVRQVQDWPFSSFHQWVRSGDLPREWGRVEAAGGGGFGERGESGTPGGAQAHPTGDGAPSGAQAHPTRGGSRA